MSEITKPHYKRGVSGELDVFEATRYFSDFNEPSTTIEYSRIQTQKQGTVTEHRQNRIHPETERVLVVKPQENKEMMGRGGSKKLTSFLNSLLRSAGLKKSKSTLKVEITPRAEKRMRRKSCVVMSTHAVEGSPISGTGAWSFRRSFDEKEAKNRDQKLKFEESLCLDKRVRCRNDGCESDSSSDESDLFELDLFAKSIP